MFDPIKYSPRWGLLKTTYRYGKILKQLRGIVVCDLSYNFPLPWGVAGNNIRHGKLEIVWMITQLAKKSLLAMHEFVLYKCSTNCKHDAALARNLGYSTLNGHLEIINEDRN